MRVCRNSMIRSVGMAGGVCCAALRLGLFPSVGCCVFCCCYHTISGCADGFTVDPMMCVWGVWGYVWMCVGVCGWVYVGCMAEVGRSAYCFHGGCNIMKLCSKYGLGKMYSN